MVSPKAKVTSRIISEWTTSSGLTPEINTICDSDVVSMLADFVEQGCPLSIALDMAGVPEESYREWLSKGAKGEAPFEWACTIIKKAQATYIYTQILELNMADGAIYKKYLEILKLRNGAEWGGEGLDLTDEEFSSEFL